MRTLYSGVSKVHGATSRIWVCVDKGKFYIKEDANGKETVKETGEVGNLTSEELIAAARVLLLKRRGL